MQIAAFAIVVAIVTTLTNWSANSDPISSSPDMEPKAEAAASGVSVEAAAATVAEVVAAESLDVLEQPADNIRGSLRASMEQICSTLETAASHHELPISFFARLIWQESRFKVDARSPVGARGIAQFMPGTAEWRGLADPLDPIESLRKSADYLRELRQQFGNLGFAAAAYNGGSGRVQKWLKGRGGMPRETRDYVRIVTGSPIEEWRAKDGMVSQAGRIPLKVPCPAIVAVAAASAPDPAVKKEALPVRVVESPRSRRVGKRHKRGPKLKAIASIVVKERAAARSERGRRGTKLTRHGHTRSVVSRRVASRGRTAMSDIQIERRAQRM